MKNCKNCNAQINDDAKFCTFCGAVQEDSQTAVQTEVPDASQNAAGSGAPESFGANTYFNPGSDQSTVAFNGGAVVENVSASKKKKGKAILPVIIGIIVAVAVAFVVKNAMTGVLSGNKIEAGVVDGNSYINSSVDVKITCPDGWDIITGTELARVANGGTVMDDGRVAYEEGGVYECMFSTDIGENIIVSTIDGNIADAFTTEEEFIADMADSFSASGAVAGQPYTLQIGENTFSCIDASSVTQGVDVQQTMCVVKEGKQYFAVIFTLFPEYEENTVQSLIDNYFTSAD